MEYEFLKIVEKDKVVELVLNRSEALNALSTPMLKEIALSLSTVNRAKQDIVVLKGEGRAFCVGADIKERKQGLSLEAYFMERVLTMQRIASLLRSTEKIVIAVLHGHVIGGGLVLSLYADFRIATEDTIFRLPEIDVGSTLLCGGYKALIDNIGFPRAKELLLLGESIGAGDAEKLNLIHKKVPIEQLEKTLDELIDRLSHKPPLPLKFMKKALIRAMEGGFEEMLLQEAVDAAVIHYSKKERVD